MKAIKITTHLLALVIVLMAVFVSYRHYKGDNLLSVQTGSMVPTFYPGDAVVTSRVRLDQLSIGDIVAYRNPKDPKVIVSHRLIGVNYQTGKLITEGDALDLQDVPFNFSLMVGRVEGVVPNAGLALDWLHRPAGLISVVYIPAALVLVSEARRLAKQYKRPYYQLYGYR